MQEPLARSRANHRGRSDSLPMLKFRQSQRSTTFSRSDGRWTLYEIGDFSNRMKRVSKTEPGQGWSEIVFLVHYGDMNLAESVN